jgi:purine-binding chemotaxis protein CheW
MSDRVPIQQSAQASLDHEEGGDLEPTQFLTFMLAGETYAIGILAIKEINEYKSVTEVPMMPASVRGVINLRGAVVPVVDLLARFGRQPSAITKRSCIVIVEVLAGEERQTIGVVVDAVNEVLDIAPEDIEPAPSFGTRVRSDFVRGIGKVKEKFVILLDVNHVLSIDELSALVHVDASATAAATESA